MKETTTKEESLEKVTMTEPLAPKVLSPHCPKQQVLEWQCSVFSWSCAECGTRYSQADTDRTKI